MTNDELTAEVNAFLAEGSRGESEDLEAPPRITVARFSRPMPILNASGIAGRAPVRYTVENMFARATATNWSIGGISAASSVREIATHTA